MLAVFLFMRKMIRFSDVSVLRDQLEDSGDGGVERYALSADVEIGKANVKDDLEASIKRSKELL